MYRRTNMPKYQMNYSNTVIYKIVCKNINITDCYVGHTTNLDSRIKQHKQACFNVKSQKHHLKVYQFIRDNGGWYNWYVIKVIDIECIDRYDAMKVQREYFEKLRPTLNQVHFDENKYRDLVIQHQEQFIRYINEKVIEKCVQ